MRRQSRTTAVCAALLVSALLVGGCQAAAPLAPVLARVLLQIGAQVAIEAGAQYIEELREPDGPVDAPLVAIAYQGEDGPTSTIYQIHGISGITIRELEGTVTITGDRCAWVVTVAPGTSARIELVGTPGDDAQCHNTEPPPPAPSTPAPGQSPPVTVTVPGPVVTTVTVAPPPAVSNYTATISPLAWAGGSTWDTLGPTAETNPVIADYGATHTHAFGDEVGRFDYTVSLPLLADSQASVSARLSSNFVYYTAPEDGYSDVTLVVNGTSVSTQRVIPDNGSGQDYTWQFSTSLLHSGQNTISFVIPASATYRNGLCIYYESVVSGLPDAPIRIETWS